MERVNPLAQAVYSVVLTRRDVRSQFTGEPIDPQILGRILQGAHSAPSVGMSQPWDFILVDDVGQRETFRDHVLSERQIFLESLDPARRETFLGIRIEGILESSLGIVVTYDPSRGSPAVLGRHAIADAGLYSVCLAIENLWLCAQAESIGVGWVSFYREEFLAELVGLPAGVRPVAWLCIGPVSHFEATPDLERLNWQSRRPILPHVARGRYGEHNGLFDIVTLPQ
ncbi:MAG: 5,6-dimethylbenzimidazole synthase [Acidimicrobiales bacterium]